MRLPSLLILIALACGCSGQPRPPALVSPVPPTKAEGAADAHGTGEAKPATGATGADSATDSLTIPPLPLLDTLFPPTELDAELRLAADSAADEAALAEIEDAAPATDGPEEGADEEEPGAAVGGAKTVGDAVTWDIDVASFNTHNRVQYYLDLYQGPARERFGIWLNRMPRYERMIRERLQEQGLPGDLVYLALIESGFSNTATSRAKAVGIWQFMKGTARLYGLRVDSWVDERRDPYRATHAAVRHLKELNRRFGSLYLAAAAYNAGSGKLSRSLVRLPDNDADSVNTDATFFRLYDTKLLRRETRDYVPKLIAAALIAKEPGRYGFTLADSQPMRYDSIIVPTMTGLDVIARLADTTVAAIRELNPQYLRLATPPGVSSIVRVPAGRGPATETAYAALPPARRITFVEHVVARGETMSGIAARHRVSTRILIAANPRLRERRLRPGQIVIVPTGGALSTAVARHVAAPAVPVESTPSGFHRVRRGETLSSIAVDFGVSQAALRRWNALGRGGRIYAGQRLRVRAPDSAHASAKLRDGARTHVVQWGETLTGLAKRYGVSVQALREANNLSADQALKAGVALRIPG